MHDRLDAPHRKPQGGRQRAEKQKEQNSAGPEAIGEGLQLPGKQQLPQKTGNERVEAGVIQHREQNEQQLLQACPDREFAHGQIDPDPQDGKRCFRRPAKGCKTPQKAQKIQGGNACRHRTCRAQLPAERRRREQGKGKHLEYFIERQFTPAGRGHGCSLLAFSNR